MMPLVHSFHRLDFNLQLYVFLRQTDRWLYNEIKCSIKHYKTIITIIIIEVISLIISYLNIVTNNKQ